MHQEFTSPIALQHTIKCFWYDRINAGGLQPTFEVVPDGYTEIIFYFGSSCSILTDGLPQPLTSPFMMGLLNKSAVFQAPYPLDIIGVRCYPWTIFNLLGVQSGKAGVQPLNHPVAILHPALNKLISAGRIPEAITLVENYFLTIQPQVATNSLLQKAGEAITKGKGTLPVSEVAAEAHLTVRTLERNFKQSSGYSVKDVSGLIRFEQVRNRLLQEPDANLAGLAQELGYADQSHLSREFKRYSGTTPSVFAKNNKKG